LSVAKLPSRLHHVVRNADYSRAESAARSSGARCAVSDFAAPDAGSERIAGDGRLKLMVRACSQCNSTAGSKLFKSFAEKRAYIRNILERRYGSTRLGDAPELPFIAKAIIVQDDLDLAA
jgi:hypothetical protein